DGGRSHLGLIRILAELPPGVSLPQQIPTLIEFDLDGFQPYLIVIGEFALPVEMLLLVNKAFDLLQDGVIGRRFSHVNHLTDSPLSISPGLMLGLTPSSDHNSLCRRYVAKML